MYYDVPLANENEGRVRFHGYIVPAPPQSLCDVFSSMVKILNIDGQGYVCGYDRLSFINTREDTTDLVWNEMRVHILLVVHCYTVLLQYQHKHQKHLASSSYLSDVI